MARTPKRKTGPRARPPARPRRYTRKPGTGSRRQPMSGYGAARRNPGKAAAQGATNFSPEPNRIGRDAYVRSTDTNYSGLERPRPGEPTKYHKTKPLISTSEHFEYGPTGDPARRGGGRQAQSSARYYTAWYRNQRSPQWRAGNIRRRAR